MTDYHLLPGNTRVWIYQADRPFADEDLPAVREAIARFADSWVSHNRQLRSFGNVLHGRFVVLMVDESQADASGCSIDKSVYFLKSLQAEYGVDLFDRMTFSYREGDQIHTVPREAFTRLYQEGKITDDTLVFDTLVDNKVDFEKNWIKPLKDSWHKRLV